MCRRPRVLLHGAIASTAIPSLRYLFTKLFLVASNCVQQNLISNAVALELNAQCSSVTRLLTTLLGYAWSFV